MELRRTIVAGGLLSVALAGIPRTAERDSTLEVPNRANANVSIAAEGQFVVAVWSASASAGGTDVFASVSRDAGATFGQPARVNSTPGDARVNGEQPPRVTLVRRSGDPEIVAIWTAKREGRTMLLTGRSADGGRSFGRTSPVAGTDAPGNRGWEAIASDPQGRVGAVWLDHRDLEARDGSASPTHHHHTTTSGAAPPSPEATADGVARAQLSKLYFAGLDGDAKPQALTGGVCYCCKTALAMESSGRIYAAWRHVYEGNMRDIAFTISRDSGRSFAPPVRISRDEWQLEGCPDDGPAMAVGPREAVHIVWPTLVREGREQTIGLFHTTSVDARAFTSRQRLDTRGVPHHPQLALGDDGLVAAAWDESADGRRQAVLATGRLDASGRLSLQRTALSGAEPASYPVVAFAGSVVVAAWTSGDPSTSVIRVRQVATR